MNNKKNSTKNEQWIWIFFPKQRNSKNVMWGKKMPGLPTN